MANVLSQAAQRLDLEWTKGDPVSLSFIWPDQDLTGSYTGPVRDAERGGTLIKSLTVATTFLPGEGTRFDLTMSAIDSDAFVVDQEYWHGITQVNGVTRLWGKVLIKDGRQV